MKYVLIDLDGTILDFNKGEAYAFTEVIKNFSNYTLKKEDILLFSEINERLFNSFANGEMKRIEFQEARFKEIFKRLNIKCDEKEANRFFLNTLKYKGIIYSDVLEGLNYLKKKYRLFIASNGMREVQLKRIESAGILNYFEKLYVSDEIGFNKPYNEFFEYIFKDLNDYKMDEYIIIGDRLETDILGGINVKIKTILINRNKAIIEDIKPDYIIESFFEVANIL